MKLLEQAKHALEAHNMPCQIFPTRTEAREWLLSQLTSGCVIGTGGSQTIEKDLGLHPDLDRIGTFLSPYRPGLTPEQALDIRKRSFWVDYYFMSSNAVTLEGELVNTDGTGNRIASVALQVGPRKIFVVAGRNKIVKDRAAAFQRIRDVAAPLNARRLHKRTDCVQIGQCMDCRSEDRICTNTLITSWQADRERISVILINEDLGY